MRRKLFILLGCQATLALGLLSTYGVTVAGLQQRLAGTDKITVIDIRSPIAYGQEHIPGAINIPASLCPLKKLPPLGQVVVCGDGLGSDASPAAAALAAKPGLKVELLEGGFAAWKSFHNLTTRGTGLKHDALNYITYARLKAASADGVVLVDLRKQTPAASPGLTDLAAEFPGLKRARSMAEALPGASGAAPLLVLIDSGDGTAEDAARKLKAAGAHSYVILAGGEFILARHGQAGLQRNAPGTTVLANKPSTGGAK